MVINKIALLKIIIYLLRRFNLFSRPKKNIILYKKVINYIFNEELETRFLIVVGDNGEVEIITNKSIQDNNQASVLFLTKTKIKKRHLRELIKEMYPIKIVRIINIEKK